MASITTKLTVTWRFPFWWRPYVYALRVLNNSGMLRVDTEINIAFIARHCRFYLVSDSGKLLRIKSDG